LKRKARARKLAMDEMEKIREFVALTQTDEAFAQSFLEAAGYDFQQAVELYLGAFCFSAFNTRTRTFWMLNIEINSLDYRRRKWWICCPGQLFCARSRRARCTTAYV